MSAGSNLRQQNARLRWLVNTHEWQPSQAQVAVLLGGLPVHEQRDVLAFTAPEDRKRALASRIMQRAAACASGLMSDLPAARTIRAMPEVPLFRTHGRKPFLKLPEPGNHSWAPNWNFSVSHEGHYTALASEPCLLVGVDVAAPMHLRGRGRHALQPFMESAALYKSSFATTEWDLLLTTEPAHQPQLFAQLWSLKEAYIKARGDGLGFAPLSRACFALADDGVARLDHPVAGHVSASLTVDGVFQDRWAFTVHPLPAGHVVSTALGPVCDVVDQDGVFQATFQAPHMTLTNTSHRDPLPWQELDVPRVLEAAGAPAHGLLCAYLHVC